MTRIAAIIPTFGRAAKLEGVALNIRDNSKTPVAVVFVTEADDTESVAEAARLAQAGLAETMTNTRKKTYAGAANCAIGELLSHGVADWFFLGSDDVYFGQNWDSTALAAASPGFLVIGTNDLHNPYVLQGIHATHSLVHRSYATDARYTYDPGMAGQLLFEGYDHNFTDAEFIGAAQAADVFTPCMTSVVEHCHPDWVPSAWDDTYAKGRLHLRDDLEVFRSREHLWTDSPAHDPDYETYCKNAA